MLDAAIQVVPNATELVPNQLGCGSRWICCQTHPQAERWARDNLERQGYVTYLPLCVVTRRDRVTRSMTRQVEVPLFRGYLFVTNADHWPPIQHTRGIARLLMSNGKPHHLNAGAVEAVRAAEAIRRCLPAENASWAPGTPCSLRKGYALDGLPAVVTDVHHGTATIAIMMLGHLRSVSVPLDCLRARDE